MSIQDRAEQAASGLRSPESVGVAALRDVLSDWLAFAEEELGEFDLEDEDDCYGEPLCPKCRSSGCIQSKIRRTRKLLEQNL